MARSLGWYIPEQLVLKITLAGSEPKIWRRVEVHSALTLQELHHVIQCVFSWHNSHLYHFLVPPGGKLTRTAMRDAIRYQMPGADVMFGDEPDEEDRHADEAMIGQVFTSACKQIVYEYDFGDSWEHIVKLEKRTRGGDQTIVPQCLAGKNAGPPEDVGGIYGYREWVDALRDVNHPSHDEAVEVLGEDFDPLQFDLAHANRRLAGTFKPPPPKRRPKPKK